MKINYYPLVISVNLLKIYRISGIENICLRYYLLITSIGNERVEVIYIIL